MAQTHSLRTALLYCGVGSLLVAGSPLRADDPADTRQQLQRLQEQNRALQDQLHRQQAVIDSLTRSVASLQQTTDQLGRNASASSAAAEPPALPQAPTGFGPGQVRISGEGGMLFWKTGSDGFAPNSEFRIDEARLFVESPVIDNVYAYVELNLATREEPDIEARLGEAYLDFENVSRLWGQDRQLNVRFGRFFAPFGEEYQTRYAIDNPLISHSLADIWTVDEGLELYGCLGRLSYAVAVQNGGTPDTSDFDRDKAVIARLGYDPTARLHLSVSAMRTGDLDVHGDKLSAAWFGGGFFRSLGSAATTKFHANLLEGDLQYRLPHGSLHAFGGCVHYDDNDPTGSNRRDVYYYSLEAIQDITRKFYAGVRFGQIFAHNGFPIVGNGDFGDYLFGDLTQQIWRLSLGAGYRYSPNLVFKAEYTFEGGKTTTGEQRDHENLFGVQAAFRF